MASDYMKCGASRWPLLTDPMHSLDSIDTPVNRSAHAHRIRKFVIITFSVVTFHATAQHTFNIGNKIWINTLYQYLTGVAILSL